MVISLFTFHLHQSMTVMVDPGALRPPLGGAILESLQKAGVKYEVQAQPLDNMVSFWREVTEVKELEPRQVGLLYTLSDSEG